jgi:repressor LexA
MTFSERLLFARKEKGLTQEQLAEAIGVAKSTYTGYEKGNREPDLFKIKKLIEVLGVSSSWLLGLDNNDGGVSISEWKMLKAYRALDERGKAAVDATLEREYKESTRLDVAVADAASTAREVAAAVETEKRPAGAKK